MAHANNAQVIAQLIDQRQNVVMGFELVNRDPYDHQIDASRLSIINADAQGRIGSNQALARQWLEAAFDFLAYL
jgi:hypothetical protein